MPFVHVRIAGPALAAEQVRNLQSRLTRAMAETLNKKAELTVVAIEQTAAAAWSVGGAALAQSAWTAQLDAYITQGTNSAAQRAEFLAAADEILRAQWAAAAATPVYGMVHEMAAECWGYDGATQEARRAPIAALPRTLSETAGARADALPRAADCALVLIDFQREYLDGSLPLPGLQAAVQAAVQLVDAADAAGVPVIHVHHEGAPGARLFAAASPGAQPLKQLPVGPAHHRIVKSMPSAFCETDLAPLLQRLQRGTLLLAGCMTHNCVDSTAREALHRGYTVFVAEDACATRALPGIDGGALPARQVHRASLAALADRHAAVRTSQAIRAAWSARHA